MEPADDGVCRWVDEKLQSWRQGDCVVGEQWFFFRTDLRRPLTSDGAFAVAQGFDAAESKIHGFMVVTQTCDIVRTCATRPFIEVCPLVDVDASTQREIERGRRPRYAFIPGLSERLLVADLDRVMTVEKSVVADWDRVEGCREEVMDRRRLSIALARKRARVAFPDDFAVFVAPLMSRLSEKHDKASPEGKALRALREIRVRAEPSWNAEMVKLFFWFIREEDLEQQGWTQYLDAWLNLIPPRGRFTEVDGEVQALADMTAKDYVESDVLDLDHLSQRG